MISCTFSTLHGVTTQVALLVQLHKRVIGPCQHGLGVIEVLHFACTGGLARLMVFKKPVALGVQSTDVLEGRREVLVGSCRRILVPLQLAFEVCPGLLLLGN